MNSQKALVASLAALLIVVCGNVSVFAGYQGGINVYEYVQSKPTTHVDPTGMWGVDVHLDKTHTWAGISKFKNPEATNIIANADEGVDSNFLTSPLTPGKDGQGRHLNKGGGGSADSRQQWYDKEYKTAVNYIKKGKCQDAAEAFGRGLHSLQDSSAHRNYPTGQSWAFLAVHPGWWDYYGPLPRPDVNNMHWSGGYAELNDYRWHYYYEKQAMRTVPDDYDWWTNSPTQIASQRAAMARVEQDSLSALSSFRADIIANDKKCKCVKKLLRPK